MADMKVSSPIPAPSGFDESVQVLFNAVRNYKSRNVKEIRDLSQHPTAEKAEKSWKSF